MRREEFDSMAKALGYDTTEISKQDFRLIDLVYNFYPCLNRDVEVPWDNAMMQVAELVGEYGMRIIRDMKGTALRARKVELAMAMADDVQDSLEEEMRKLRTGEDE